MATDGKKKDPIVVTVATCNLCSAQKSAATYHEARSWADVHLAMHKARGESR